MKESEHQLTWEAFRQVDIRVGTIVAAESFAEARVPAIKLQIDLGTKFGIRKSSAQISVGYDPSQLIGRQVLAVVNFPPKQIGPLMSEVLVLGLKQTNGKVTLVRPDESVDNGTRLE